MSIDFTGSNSEKIDKLVGTIIELRTTMRICFAVVGLGFPLIVGHLTFLVAQSFSTLAKVDRLSDQIAATRNDDLRLAERQDRLERPNRP
jgi:hypothetical protein